MKRRMQKNIVELLESRSLMTGEPWGAIPSLIGLDAISDRFPAVTGAGSVVAVIDTGIDYRHPALGGGFGTSNPNFKVIAGYDFVDNDADPLDTFGHGTQVAGTIAADPFIAAGRRYQGIAPDAKLIALRIGATTESVPLDRIKRALDWVLTNLDEYGIDAVNISFGFGRFNEAHTENQLGPELRQLADRGVIVTASSGNDGISAGPGIDYPAASPFVIGVGAVDEEGTIADFSQRGNPLTFLAPGVDVPTTTINLGFVRSTGTSFAAPMLAGAVALIKQISSQFSAADIRSMLSSASATTRDGEDVPFVSTGKYFNRLDLATLIPQAISRAPIDDADLPLVGRGTVNSIAVDEFGVKHLVFFDSVDQTLKYTTQLVRDNGDAGSWSSPVVVDASAPDGGRGVGTNVSLKIDSLGRPHVAYYDSVRGDLKYAFSDGDDFQISTLDSAGNTGEMPALLLDSSDTPFVAYYRRSSSELRLAEKNSAGNWIITTVDSPGNVGKFPSITLDGNNRISLAYDDSSKDDLKFAQRQPNGRWIRSVVDDRPKTGVAHTSISYDQNNRAYIAYQDLSSKDLKFAVSGKSRWSVYAPATIGETGFNNSIIYDNDLPTIVSYDRTRDTIFKSRFNGGTAFQNTTLRQDRGGDLSIVASNQSGKFLGVFRDGSSRLAVELLIGS